jgi:alanine racemase
MHGRPTVAEVSLAALRHNCRQARELVGPSVAVMAVVKADAYGHGAVAAARAFVEAGAVALGVSTVEEGVELRTSGLTAPIVVLGGVFRGEGVAVAQHGLEALCGPSTARARSRPRAAPRPQRPRAREGRDGHGTARDRRRRGARLRRRTPRDRRRRRARRVLPLRSADAVDTASRARRSGASGGGGGARRAGVRPPLVHLANSAAVLCEPAAHFTMVRPGLMLYGYPPAPHLAARAALRPAMSFRTAAVQVRHVPPLTPIGYGGTFVTGAAEHDRRPARRLRGRLPRLASNRAQVLMRGRRAPVAGRVCMDHTMIDVTDVGDVRRRAGRLFGAQDGAALGADELAGWCDTIPTRSDVVGRRVPRRI